MKRTGWSVDDLRYLLWGVSNVQTSTQWINKNSVDFSSQKVKRLGRTGKETSGRRAIYKPGVMR